VDVTYRAHCTEQRIFNGRILDCPQCGNDRDLAFTTSGRGGNVTGSCPNRHVWAEARYPAEAVRVAAIASQRKG
jgi:hypothetical protein